MLTPWTQEFKAPTAEEARNTPGYEFQRSEGLRNLENSSAASGGLLTGGTLKGIQEFGQGLADTTYSQTYGRALQQYETAYRNFQGNQANTFNRLSSVAGGGQVAAANLGQLGQEASRNVSDITGRVGQQVGQNINNAGAATASGYVAGANVIGSGITGITSMLELLRQQRAAKNGGDASAYSGA